MHNDQYPIVAARRHVYDTLLWQVPTIGIAAQGVLLSAALNSSTPHQMSTVLWILALLVGIAVLRLFERMRFHEVYDSELLRNYEALRESEGYAVVHGQRTSTGKIIVKRASPWLGAYRIWFATLSVFLSFSFWGSVTSIYHFWDAPKPATAKLQPTPR